jgi:membrane protease YdiL (CAAX protease family)
MSLLVPRAAVVAVLFSLGFRTGHLPWLDVYFVTVNPWAEEAFWRGTIHRELRTWRHGAWLSSFLFASWHSLIIYRIDPGLCIPGVLVIAVFGRVLAWFYDRGDDLWPSTLFHGVIGDLPAALFWTWAVLAK